ncbi:MAG: Protein disulfide-isomerase A3 [Paramarteilia canceri]
MRASSLVVFLWALLARNSLAANNRHGLVRDDVSITLSTLSKDPGTIEQLESFKVKINQNLYGSVKIEEKSEGKGATLNIKSVPIANFDVTGGIKAFNKAAISAMAHLCQEENSEEVYSIGSLKELYSALSKACGRKILFVVSRNKSLAADLSKIYSERTKYDAFVIHVDPSLKQNLELIKIIFNGHSFNTNFEQDMVLLIDQPLKAIFSAGYAQQLLNNFSKQLDSMIDKIAQYKRFEPVPKITIYYADWCQYCAKFMPEFDKAAKIAKSEELGVEFVKVDCTNSSNCQGLGIEGYPTVRFYENKMIASEAINFNYERSAQGVIKFIKEQLDKKSFGKNSTKRISYSQLLNIEQIATALNADSLSDHPQLLILTLPASTDYKNRQKLLSQFWKSSGDYSNAKTDVSSMFVLTGTNSVLDNYLDVKNPSQPNIMLKTPKVTVKTEIDSFSSFEEAFDHVTSKKKAAKVFTDETKPLVFFKDQEPDLSFYFNHESQVDKTSGIIHWLDPDAEMMIKGNKVFFILKDQTVYQPELYDSEPDIKSKFQNFKSASVSKDF